MVLYVAGDIGGTNSRLRLVRAAATPAQAQRLSAQQIDSGDGEVTVAEHIYPSRKYASFEAIVREFLAKYCPAGERVYCMCLAVAGPVSQNAARITNLTWVIDGSQLASTFGLEEVRVINDFVGIGYGLLALKPNELELVHGAVAGTPPAPQGVKAVIGAGTGLGECFLTHNGQNYDVWPAEGGHADFAPRNKTEFEIMEYIQKTENLSRVSVERVTSGTGLPKIYGHLLSRKPQLANPEAAKAIRDGVDDVGKLIAQYAQQGKCPLCVETMDLFVRLYGAEAGNLCLKLLPVGGLYIAGGIAAKNMPAMRKDNQFVAHFLDKGRLAKQLERIPIYLITHPQVGILGSAVICRRIIAHKRVVQPPRAMITSKL